MIATAITSGQQTLFCDRELLQQWKVTMRTSNTRARKFRSTVGKIVMALVFASMIGGISIAPAFASIRINKILLPFVEHGIPAGGSLGDDLYPNALLAAQSEKYGIGSYIDKIDDNELKVAVQIFLSIDETKPTLEALLDLKNRLVAVTFPDFRVGYDAQGHAWLLFERQGAAWTGV